MKFDEQTAIAPEINVFITADFIHVAVQSTSSKSVDGARSTLAQ
jgi:hypothetical protein